MRRCAGLKVKGLWSRRLCAKLNGRRLRAADESRDRAGRVGRAAGQGTRRPLTHRQTGSRHGGPTRYPGAAGVSATTTAPAPACRALPPAAEHTVTAVLPTHTRPPPTAQTPTAHGGLSGAACPKALRPGPAHLNNTAATRAYR